MLKHLPAGNALQRERLGEAAYWTVDTYLLALIGDVLQAANWQRAGDKHGPRPKPIPRPDAGTDRARLASGDGVSIDTMKQRLGWE